MPSQNDAPHPPVPTLAKFVIGGLAGCIAQAISHPMDVLKVHMQIFRTPLHPTMKQILTTSGVSGFYTALTASLLRQVTYTTARLGIYNTLTDIAKERYGGSLSYPALVSLGMVSGVAGSFVGTPADVVMVRMIGDIKLPPEKRRNYSNALTGLMRIVRTEGLAKMWTGALPTMGRAAIVNGSVLGTYSKSKTLLEDTGYFEPNGIFMQFLASMISGFAMGVASLPVDAAKTSIQSWSKSTKAPGMIRVMLDMVKQEGVLSLWRGFLPYYGRAAPITTITMVCMDQFTRLYQKYT